MATKTTKLWATHRKKLESKQDVREATKRLWAEHRKRLEGKK
jgi:hypothetical protein